MFLLNCIEDKSLVIVDEEQVTFEESVQDGDKVKFSCGAQGKKRWTGTVLFRSDCRDELIKHQKKILIEREKEKKMEAAKKLQNAAPLPSKRQKKEATRYSPTRDAADDDGSSKPKQRCTINKEKKEAERRTKTAKSDDLKKLFQPDNDLPDNDSSDSSGLSEGLTGKVQAKEKKLADKQTASPSKEELKRKLEEALAKLKTKGGQTSAAPSSRRILDSDISEDEEDLRDLGAKTDDGTKNDNGSTVSDNDSDNGGGDAVREEDGDGHAVREEKPQGSKKKDKKRSSKLTKLALEDLNTGDIDLSTFEGLRQLHQLYGKDHFMEDTDDKMVHFSNGVYCIKSVLSAAVGGARREITSFLRNIILGVFKKDSLKNATLTGQAPRAAGKVANPQEIVPLDPVAVDAIIRYSVAVAKKLEWEVPADTRALRQILEKTFTQKLGEIKRTLK